MAKTKQNKTTKNKAKQNKNGEKHYRSMGKIFKTYEIKNLQGHSDRKCSPPPQQNAMI